ncbi:MAG: hypothetical protein AB7K09_07760 [Planctomycetota bacterium]
MTTIDSGSSMQFVASASARQHSDALWSGSYSDFLQRVERDPYRCTRTAFQLVNDMIAHYGSESFEDSGETITHYNLFDDPFDGGLRKVYGLGRTIMRLVKYIRSAAREEGKERIFVFHGPVGTAKTSMLDLIGRGLEDYTMRPDGEVFTWRWIFGKRFADEEQHMGFGAAAAADTPGMHSGETDPVLGEVIATIPCQFHENPLLLIPRPIRRELLERVFLAKYGDGPDRPVIPHKVLEAEPNYNDRQILDYLLRRYKGDWERAMQHVRVERFSFAEPAGRGIAKVFPEGNVETGAQPISFDENYRFLANMINSLNLVRFGGKYVMGNRGIIHYSDIFKKPVHYLQHLLAAVEEHKVDFGDINVDVDLMILGSTNPFEYHLLRQEPISQALRSRMRKIDVPYLLAWKHEKKIYDTSLRQARRYRHFAPHTTEMAAMFAVLTRVEKSKLGGLLPTDLFRKLNHPLAKAVIYNGDQPEGLTQKEQQLLTREFRRKLRNEHPVPDQLEGMRGIPTRILQNIFADLCEEATDSCISPFDVFRLLERVIEQGPVNYDFLGIDKDEGYHDAPEFVRALRSRYHGIVAREVESALVSVSDDEMESRIRTYLTHVGAYNRKEKLANPATGRMDDPDEQMMQGVEKIMGVESTQEERNFWRFKILSRASAHARPGEALNLKAVYADLFDSLYQSLYREKQSSVVWRNLQQALEKVRKLADVDKDLSDVDPTSRRQAQSLVQNMIDHHGYCEICARHTALYYVGMRV